MSILSGLVSNMGDDVARAATNKTDDIARAVANKLDDIAARKSAQFDLLQKTNPMLDNYHTGIRSAKEINRLQDLVDNFDADSMFTYPDFTIDNARAAVAKGTLPVFSSKPIEPGVFISPSKMMAADYAGGDVSKIFRKEIPLDDFAAILSGDEGNYLPIASTKSEGRTLGGLLSPEQESFFKNSVLRDSDNKLIPVYHSTPNTFDTFDDALLGKNTGYDNTRFGHFVTPDRDFSARFADINETGTPGRTMELYADIKNPITHPYMAGKKYSGKELDDIVENYVRLTGGEDSLDALREYAEENGTSLYDEYMDALMADSPFEFVADERKALQDAGYDAVEFIEGLKNELVDNSDSLEPISSYAVFGGNQLKDIGNKNPTKNPNIFLGLGGLLGGGSILGALLGSGSDNTQNRA